MFLKKKRGLVLSLLVASLIIGNLVISSGLEAKATVKLQLLMVDWNSDVKELFDKKILPLFEENNPNVKVTVDWSAWDVLDVKIMTGFAAGVYPDLFQADNVEFGPKYYQKGLIQELDPYLAKVSKEVMDDFYSKAISRGSTLGGKIVALPYVLDNRALFYRKDFFREAGLDPEVPPRNWEELRETALKLTKRDPTGEFKRAGFWTAGAGVAIPVYHAFSQFLWQNGGSYFNEAEDKCVVNSPAGVETLEFWASLKDKVGPVEDIPNVGDLDPLSADLVAMSFQGFWVIHNAKKYKPELYKDIGITVLGQKQKASLWYANTYFMPKGKHTNEAWKLLSFLVLDRENFADYLKALGGLPPRKSIAATLEEPLYSILIDKVMNAPGSNTTPSAPFTVEVFERICEGVGQALYGKVTPKQALDKAAAEANEIIERVGWTGW